MVAEVSVVVPARNAAATLVRTLAALERQDFSGEAEVIVVDDASSDDTATMAERAGVRVVRHPSQRGPAASRNSGAAVTTAPFLAFTDADCEPEPGWLASGMRALRFADLVTGPVEPVPGVDVRPFDRTLRISEVSPRFESASLFVTRDLFARLEGFAPFAATSDASRSRPGLRPRIKDGHFGEDAVFGWRARATGARIAFEPEARVLHAVFPRGPRAWIAERWRFRYFPALLREIPQMRSELPLGVFLSRRTALFDLAVTGLIGGVALRRPWPLVAALPYARAYLRTDELWRRSAVRENLALSLGDAVGLVALVRGSIAARTLVL